MRLRQNLQQFKSGPIFTSAISYYVFIQRAFSVLTIAKSKYWSTLEKAEDDLCPVISIISQDLILYEKRKMKAHSSHMTTYTTYTALLVSNKRQNYKCWRSIFEN